MEFTNLTNGFEKTFDQDLIEKFYFFIILNNCLKVLHSVVEAYKNKQRLFLCMKIIFKNK